MVLTKKNNSYKEVYKMGTFANRLKSLRLKYDLSQQELADELNISKSSVSMYENGQREPNFKILKIIANFFNVDVNYLIGYSENAHSKNRISKDEIMNEQERSFTITLQLPQNVEILGRVQAVSEYEAVGKVFKHIPTATYENIIEIKEDT